MEGHGPSRWAVHPVVLGPILVRKAFLVPSSRGYLFEKFTRAEVEKELNQMFKISLNPVYLCKQESRRIGTGASGSGFWSCFFCNLE